MHSGTETGRYSATCDNVAIVAHGGGGDPFGVWRLKFDLRRVKA
jgi:hypothetical protein